MQPRPLLHRTHAQTIQGQRSEPAALEQSRADADADAVAVAVAVADAEQTPANSIKMSTHAWQHDLPAAAIA